MTEPSKLALDTAAIVAARVQKRKAPVRRAFVVRSDPIAPPPPMSHMLRGGRGGEVRLKLYLSMLWFAGKPPHDVTYPARAWASLLDLDDPEGNGARRVNDAIRWLAEARYVDLERRPGRPSRVLLLDETGVGSPYRPPWDVIRELRESQDSGETVSQELLSRNTYFSLSPLFWTEGWMARLSGRGLAMFLAVSNEWTRSASPPPRVWFSPGRARQLFDISTETRSLAFKELNRLKLVETRRQPVNADVFDFKRVRNTYVLGRAELLPRGEEQADET